MKKTTNFNGIDCFDEMTCIAAAEGHNCANPGALLMMGEKLGTPGSDAGGGAMGARMVSKTEGWIAAGVPTNLD